MPPYYHDTATPFPSVISLYLNPDHSSSAFSAASREHFHLSLGFEFYFHVASPTLVASQFF